MLNNNSPQMPPVSPVGSAPISSAGAYAAPPVAPVKVRSGDSSLLKIIIIILLSLLLIGALLLAYYFYMEYNATRSDVDAQIEAAVLDANKVLEDELQAKFAEEEKNPYRTFTGPSDYGSLSFKYPKTWSVYVEKDASKSGDFQAYLHPEEVHPISNESINALSVNITTQSYEEATQKYAGQLKDGKLTSSVIKINGEDATRYDGAIDKEKTGSVVLIKIRDKVATLQTDAEIYREDFDKILKTITFNQ